MNTYLVEFLPLLLVFALALISPGPDFFLTLRQALVHGRRAAIFSSLGIGSAIIFHVSYTILGLGLVIAQSLFLFNLIKWAGVAYLLYLGFKALSSKGSTVPTQQTGSRGSNSKIINSAVLSSPQPLLKSYLAGLTINLLNPKAVIFFLSIFSSFVATTTPLEIKFTYGFIIASIAASWFIIVSLLMTTSVIRQLFSRISKWIDRASGFVFIALGIRLIFQKPN